VSAHIGQYIRYLFRRFTEPENHFTNALPQRSMIIDLRKAQIRKRSDMQPLQCLVGRNVSGRYTAKQICYFFFRQAPPYPPFRLTELLGFQ
jgi:hypothetical protein